MSRDEIAHDLGVSRGELDDYASGGREVPASIRLALVGVLKTREVALEGVASALFEEGMRRGAVAADAANRTNSNGS